MKKNIFHYHIGERLKLLKFYFIEIRFPNEKVHFTSIFKLQLLLSFVN